MSLTAVETELGAPDAKVTLESGGTRFVYSLQPMSEQVWWIDFNEKGEVVSRQNVLDREHFALIRPGVDTKETVWNLFGKCAEESHFALVNQDAWMYRFLDEGFFHMACWVQFDMKGVVTEVGYTIDPWWDRDGLFSDPFGNGNVSRARWKSRPFRVGGVEKSVREDRFP